MASDSAQKKDTIESLLEATRRPPDVNENTKSEIIEYLDKIEKLIEKIKSRGQHDINVGEEMDGKRDGENKEQTFGKVRKVTTKFDEHIKNALDFNIKSMKKAMRVIASTFKCLSEIKEGDAEVGGKVTDKNYYYKSVPEYSKEEIIDKAVRKFLQDFQDYDKLTIKIRKYKEKLNTDDEIEYLPGRVFCLLLCIVMVPETVLGWYFYGRVVETHIDALGLGFIASLLILMPGLGAGFCLRETNRLSWRTHEDGFLKTMVKECIKEIISMVVSIPFIGVGVRFLSQYIPFLKDKDNTATAENKEMNWYAPPLFYKIVVVLLGIVFLLIGGYIMLFAYTYRDVIEANILAGVYDFNALRETIQRLGAFEIEPHSEAVIILGAFNLFFFIAACCEGYFGFSKYPDYRSLNEKFKKENNKLVGELGKTSEQEDEKLHNSEYEISARCKEKIFREMEGKKYTFGDMDGMSGTADEIMQYAENINGVIQKKISYYCAHFDTYREEYNTYRPGGEARPLPASYKNMEKEINDSILEWKELSEKDVVGEFRKIKDEIDKNHTQRGEIYRILEVHFGKARKSLKDEIEQAVKDKIESIKKHTAKDPQRY